MRRWEDLDIADGEIVFVDAIDEGVARLLIGPDGSRVETVRADDLPEPLRRAGLTLSVTEGVVVLRDTRDGNDKSSVIPLNNELGDPPDSRDSGATVDPADTRQRIRTNRSDSAESPRETDGAKNGTGSKNEQSVEDLMADILGEPPPE